MKSESEPSTTLQQLEARVEEVATRISALDERVSRVVNSMGYSRWSRDDRFEQLEARISALEERHTLAARDLADRLDRLEERHDNTRNAVVKYRDRLAELEMLGAKLCAHTRYSGRVDETPKHRHEPRDMSPESTRPEPAPGVYSPEQLGPRSEEHVPDAGKMAACPFCGSDLTGTVIKTSGDHQHFWIYCWNCSARGPLHPTPERAVEAWNKRSGE